MLPNRIDLNVADLEVVVEEAVVVDVVAEEENSTAEVEPAERTDTRKKLLVKVHGVKLLKILKNLLKRSYYL